ncbi:hypothetical protein H6G33_18720 [Calothrix sp. FACHB-1219]|uniref:hypothetical protein n=1 Tax=unclassified Calothrix TaxID=2619626 RepID=UPI001688F66B|nr:MULTISPECIES: hypothetical protein [unclassified Calothrix]MBD2203466.1 hypothetical protein [Calothrix sp. FACHB-168]MBD2219058.1 hypothetical protein [Calothrix sp. FACHB-1219]
MNLLPYDRFTIFTPEIVPVVSQRLSSKIETAKMLQFPDAKLPYYGTISAESFNITRNVYRKLFIPVIKGSLETQSQQTAVHIQMNLHPAAIGFLIFLFWFWYGGFMPIMLQDALPIYFKFIFLSTPLGLLFIVWSFFWSEVKKTRSELADIIQGQL